MNWFDWVKFFKLNLYFLFFRDLYLNDCFSFLEHCFHFSIDDIAKHLLRKFEKKFKKFAKLNLDKSIQYFFNDVSRFQLLLKYLSKFFKSFKSFECFRRDFEFNLFNSLIFCRTRFKVDFRDHFSHFNIVN